MSVLEVVMLVCFGASWPFSIAKTLRTGEAAGKSPAFLLIIIAGYLAGVGNKLLTSMDWITGLYALNLCMVSTDLWLCLRAMRRKKTREPQASNAALDRGVDSMTSGPSSSPEITVSGQWSIGSRRSERRQLRANKKWPRRGAAK